MLSPRGDFHEHPLATDDPAEIGPVDVVFLGLKAYSYAGCGPLLAPLLHDGTAVVAAQNGVPWWYFHRHGGPYDGRRIEAVDPGGATSAAIPPERAIGCVVYCSTELEAPGVVRHGEGTRFSLGEPDRSRSERCLQLSEALVAGGLKAPVEPDLRDEIWIKLLGNAVFNPLSVLTRATLAAMCRNPATRALARAGMEECLAIANALGVQPQIEIERRIDGAEARRRAPHLDAAGSRRRQAARARRADRGGRRAGRADRHARADAAGARGLEHAAGREPGPLVVRHDCDRSRSTG